MLLWVDFWYFQTIFIAMNENKAFESFKTMNGFIVFIMKFYDSNDIFTKMRE